MFAVVAVAQHEEMSFAELREKRLNGCFAQQPVSEIHHSSIALAAHLQQTEFYVFDSASALSVFIGLSPHLAATLS